MLIDDRHTKKNPYGLSSLSPESIGKMLAVFARPVESLYAGRSKSRMRLRPAHNRRCKLCVKRNSFLGSDSNRLVQAAKVRARMPSLDEQISLIRRLYHFRGEAEVSNFLRENPYLLELLKEARHKIPTYFGDEAGVFLEVFYDPEDSEESGMLNTRIAVDMPLEDARRILDRLDDDWWLEVCERSNGRMNIFLDYAS